MDSQKVSEAADRAAFLIHTHGAASFRVSVQKAAQAFGVSWYDVQRELARRSGAVRHQRAVKKRESDQTVREVLALCEQHRRSQSTPKPQSSLF